MSLKIIVVAAFSILFYLLSKYVTAQISQLNPPLAIGIAFLIDIVIYFITAVIIAFIVNPRTSKENGRMMISILTGFLLLHLTLNSAWIWLTSASYLITIGISYVLAFLIGRLGFKLLTSSENKDIKKSPLKKRATKTKKSAKRKTATKKGRSKQ